MKKFLLLILAVCVIGGVNAQKIKSYAVKDMRKAIWKNPHVIDNPINLSFIPFKPVNHISSKKVYTSIPIGTSGNVYMCLVDMVRWLTFNPELNMITFGHRMGGSGGGTSGNIRVKYSNDFFSTKDSVDFIQTGGGLCRYPSNILYNPYGNTDPLNALSIIVGPSTGGSGWVNNYFGSQTLGGADIDLQLIPLDADTFKFPTNGFSGGNGMYHALTGVSMSVTESQTLYFQMYNSAYNSGTNTFEWTSSNIQELFKFRTWSNATSTYNAHENSLFQDDGLNGFFYAIGKDSLDNPGNSAMPIVWKTSDGGVTFTKEIYQHFATMPALQTYIYPTRLSYLNNPTDSTQWVYRPNISAGSSVDEGNTPGTIDMNGNLHIAAIVEGLWSTDPDSLEYGYAAHPKFLFDLIRTDTGWNALFIDTINSNFVTAAESPFIDTPENQGWGHWIRMSKNADGSKVFATWTDTDAAISGDSINSAPDVHGWAFDVSNNMMTTSTRFTQDYMFFYMMAADKVAQVGSTYKIPVTYIDIFASNQVTATNPQFHNYLDGIQFDEADFNIPVDLIDNVKTLALNNTESVSQTYPNPANGNANFTVTVKDVSNINVVVTNVLGQVVYQTSKTNAVSGVHTFNLDTKNWNNGVYFYTVTTGSNKITKKMIVE